MAELQLNHIYQGHAPDVLKTFPDESVDCVVTSPPYWSLRAYGTEPQIWDGDPDCDHDWTTHVRPKARGASHGDWERNSRSAGLNEPQESDFCAKCLAWRGELGLEPSMDMYVNHLCDIFDEIYRVLTKHGTLWVNISDTYYGSGNHKESYGKHGWLPDGALHLRDKPNQKGELPSKCLSLIPERFAIEMVRRGWILRNKITWHKPSVIPESVKDRFTVDFEYLYFFTKEARYYFKQQFEPIKQSSVDRYKIAQTSAGSRIPQSHMMRGRAAGTPSTHLGENREAKLIALGLRVGPPVGGKKYTKNPDEVIGADRFSGEPMIGRLNRNKRCVWSLPTAYVKEAHFATFPPALIEPPIDAGCPKQVCTKCGLPRMPIFESVAHGEFTDRKTVKPVGKDHFESGAGHKEGGFCVANHETLKEHKLVGWTKCDCGAPFRSGIVLDPFIGSGTAGIVAKKMGLYYVGIDLKQEYVEMAEERIDVDQTRLDAFL